MNISSLKNKDLLAQFSHIVTQEKEAIAAVVAHLSEIDKRRLYLEEAYSSLFEFCVKKYNYSEGGAYRRIQAARTSQKFPEIISLLESGKISLSVIKLVSVHLTPENKQSVFKQVKYKTKREVEKILACLFPAPNLIRDTIRKLPERRSIFMNKESRPIPSVSLLDEQHVGQVEDRKSSDYLNDRPIELVSSVGLPSPMGLRGVATGIFSGEQTQPDHTTGPGTSSFNARESIKPVNAHRYKIELSCSEKLTQKIKRAKEVLRHKFPEGKLEDVLDEALEALLEKKDPLRKLRRREISNVILSEAKNPVIRPRDPRNKCGTGPSPGFRRAQDVKVTTRYIPQAIKTAVWKRDGGQCTYVSSEGKRCSERGMLELDHIHPYALGGEHSVQNLAILCRRHNQWRAGQTFGFDFPKSCKPIPQMRDGSAGLMMEKG